MDDRAKAELFENSPIPKAVMTMAIPTITSSLVMVVYNLADTFFIGQTHNDILVAAVSLATPVFADTKATIKTATIVPKGS